MAKQFPGWNLVFSYGSRTQLRTIFVTKRLTGSRLHPSLLSLKHISQKPKPPSCQTSNVSATSDLITTDAAREAGKVDKDFPSLLIARGRGLGKEFCWPPTVPAPCGSTPTHPSLPSHSPRHSYSGCCLGVCPGPPQLPHLWKATQLHV